MILRILFFVCSAFSLSPSAFSAPEASPLTPETSFTRLLQTHVDDRGLVAYAAWKNSPADLAALDTYLATFATETFNPRATDTTTHAALINFYNAATLRLILENHPLNSIRDLPDPWKTVRWQLGSEKFSLDQIENQLLRPSYGWRTHAVLVCAARSCPPLQREAFTAENLSALTSRALEAWLARPDLNRFDAKKNRVEISQIFDWFAADFTAPDTVAAVLARHAPTEHRTFLKTKTYTVAYAPYDWSLNTQP